MDFTAPTAASANSGVANTTSSHKVVINYIDQDQFVEDLYWTITKLGSSDSDDLLEQHEKFEITVGSSAVGAGGGNLVDALGTDLTVSTDFSIIVSTPVGATLELERGETLPVTAGEMVAVGEMIEAPGVVATDWATIAMLRAHDQPVAPLPYQAEPSLAARIENGIARMGVGTAQFLVLGTYAAALLLLIFVPLYALAKWLRRRARTD